MRYALPMAIRQRLQDSGLAGGTTRRCGVTSLRAEVLIMAPPEWFTAAAYQGGCTVREAATHPGVFVRTFAATSASDAVDGSSTGT